MVKTGEMISIEGLTVLSDTHCIELCTVGKLLYSCKNRPKFESYFWKEIEITAEWKGLMPPNNYVQKIVHISTLFYQSLSIISPSGRKLLKMKNSKSFF